MKGSFTMAIFDDVVVNAKSAAAAVSKKAGVIYDLSKLRISLASLRSELNKQYQVLGEAVFNSEPEEEVAAIKQNIADVKQNIEDIEKVLASVRNVVKCPNCGEKLAKNAQFCYICGAPVPTEPAPSCKKCGAELVSGAAFCYKCGEPVAAEENAE